MLLQYEGNTLNMQKSFSYVPESIFFKHILKLKLNSLAFCLVICLEAASESKYHLPSAKHNFRNYLQVDNYLCQKSPTQIWAGFLPISMPINYPTRAGWPWIK